jgi:hypothetical protein
VTRPATFLSPLSFLLLLLPLLLPACASRSFTIRSNPPGSDVYVDGQYVGVTPVTIPFVYGGEREILVYPPRKKLTDTKSYWPKRFIYDTTKDEYDFPVIDLATDAAGLDDKQVVQVDLKESNLAALYEIDQDAWCAAVRARANTLRGRAREFQLSALPTDQGRDPGPLESRPATRAQPANPKQH